ncbi:DUF3718 domain-containing protein [Aliidiomarina quisquiliarum]|uniref:DUF3718 domain-containing protein n=1 Tax=Aliidiomarina quisquiliarum TaxID=2938947 RepID=UPI00208F0E90|nr:DUF3718 domain-containing protein [Aliidiomarina quisquiliarum]MCO4322620.1 DUF3718 domain-containing protein [Aliidiomarina quisquiliarum]
MRLSNHFMAFLVAAVVFMLPIKSKAADMVAEGLCSAVVADDRQRMRTILSNHNIRLRNVFTNVRCNGYSLLQFAITAEAIDVGEMLIRLLPTSAIEGDKINGESVIHWAEKAGYASSPVLAVVRERVSY